MKVCNLASGSKGNCTYVEMSNHKFLVDAGKNITYITEKLKEIDVDIKDIEYVIISHTHSDHISALKHVLKKSHATLCVPEKMFKHMTEFKDYTHVTFLHNQLIGEGFSIISFKSSHDAPDSRNFIFDDGKSMMAYITDTGYVNRNNFKMLENLDLYLFESNHDIEMLENGPYPKWLKTRVLSDEGHLSNNAAGFYLAKLIGPKTKKVLLTHLSEINNTPDKALETVYETLKDYDVKFKKISCATQDERSELISI
jgi:phosphoribosyl 1,2-cyclic phosphodiesterase